MTEPRRRKKPSHQRTLWDKFWKGDDDRYVIVQFPNKWLIGWVVLVFISFVTKENVADIFGFASDISLLVWAVLEVKDGKTGFRRLLGILGLLFVVALVVQGIKGLLH